jgi:bifunctional non-homologous end joining protein LigD
VNALKLVSCIIDGEVVVAREDGMSCFHLLRSGDRVKPQAALCAFDLLELDGEDWRQAPIEERKVRLLRLISRASRLGLQYNQHTYGDGEIAFHRICHLGLEGIVSNAVARLTSPASAVTGSRARTPRARLCAEKRKRNGDDDGN